LRDAQTVQHQYLEEAQAAHARLSALLGAMDTGILFVSSDNRVLYSNPAFHRMWPLPEGTVVVGRTPRELVAASASVLARAHEQSAFILRQPRAGEGSGAYEIQMSDGRLLTQQGHAVN